MGIWNLAELFEATAAAIPDRVAVSSPLGNRTYRELDENASAFGRYLLDSGVQPSERVAILSWNRVEWLEAMIGCFKARAVPVNVNYRYVDAEFIHILDDADATTIVAEPEFCELIHRCRDRLPQLERVVVLDAATAGGDTSRHGTPDEARWPDITANPSTAVFPDRSADDLYILYTGGTTGLPKGVLWRQEDIFLGAMTGLVDPSHPQEVLAALAPERAPWMVTSPLMHGNGQWNSIRPLLAGNGVSLWTDQRFDPMLVIEQASADEAQLLVLVGDGMARPFVETLRSLVDAGEAPDLSHLGVIASGGAILSPNTKSELSRLLPSVMVVDGFGASESGGNGALVGSGDGGAPRFQMKPNTAVLDDDLRPTAPGSGVIGRLATTGHIPLGYHKDPVKSEATFPTIDGVRWAIPGDAARLEEDGTITVFGRGSNCINTGGEKVFPEEVEAQIKAHPDIHDAFVLGRADDRFGQRVAAVIARRAGADTSLDDLRSFLREHLAGYKLPKEAVFVEALSYTGPGKPDYAWARTQFDTTNPAAGVRS